MNTQLWEHTVSQLLVLLLLFFQYYGAWLSIQSYTIHDPMRDVCLSWAVPTGQIMFSV